MQCSCPDHASLCKHIAAVFYGIGACLDHQPEWLFTLRHVDHLELVASASVGVIIAASHPSADVLEESDLSALFGIEMAPAITETPSAPPVVKKATRSKPEDPIELTLPQAAMLLKISESRLVRLLNDKTIPFSGEGKQRRIPFEEVMKYRKLGLL